MDLREYQKKAVKTFKPHRELTPHEAEILDWSLGLPGEVGEVAELVKHSIFHNEPMDLMKLAKEIGDVMWYIAALCKSYNIPLELVGRLNIAKLTHRHNGTFCFDKSAERHSRERKFEATAEYQELAEIFQALADGFVWEADDNADRA